MRVANRREVRRASRILSAVIALVAAAVVAAGCGGSSDNSSSSSGSSGSSGGAASSGSNGNTGFKAAVLTPGTDNDGSWGQAVSQGARDAAKKYNADVTIAQNLDTPAQYQQQGNAFAQAGFKVIINANASMGDVTTKLAEQYPDVHFGQIGLPLNLKPNIATATPSFPEGSFLAGALAGLLTKTDKLGTIGGFDFPTLDSEMEGFALGARYVNPKATIYRTFINTWTDTGKAKAAAQAQISKGTDIIFSATDQATQGIYQLAQGGGQLKYVVPQYIDHSSQAPNVVLATAVYNLQGATGSFIDMYGKDDWKSSNAELGVQDGVGLAPNPQIKVPADVQKKVDKIKSDIASGKLKIPSMTDLGKSGAADKIDISSLKSGS
jgi:basic membrane protein A